MASRFGNMSRLLDVTNLVSLVCKFPYYNSLIFYSVVMSFSCIFYKKHNFNCAKRFFPFAIFLFLCFNGTPQHESKNTRLKDCHSSEFFSIELITITNSINKAERHLDFCYFALSKLNFKQNKRLKFYQLLILLSGDISLNSGPCQYLSDKNKNLFEPFRKRGFLFLHINVNSYGYYIPHQTCDIRNY